MKHLGHTSSIERPIDQSLLSRLTRPLRAIWNAWPDVHGRWHREAVARKALAEQRAMKDRHPTDHGVTRSDRSGVSKGLRCAPQAQR